MGDCYFSMRDTVEYPTSTKYNINRNYHFFSTPQNPQDSGSTTNTASVAQAISSGATAFSLLKWDACKDITQALLAFLSAILRAPELFFCATVLAVSHPTNSLHSSWLSMSLPRPVHSLFYRLLSFQEMSAASQTALQSLMGVGACLGCFYATTSHLCGYYTI